MDQLGSQSSSNKMVAVPNYRHSTYAVEWVAALVRNGNGDRVYFGRVKTLNEQELRTRHSAFQALKRSRIVFG